MLNNKTSYNLKKEEIKINDINVNAYKLNTNYYLIYGKNTNTGDEKWYTYEAVENTIQPFNENMLRPCPMLENAGRIQELVKQSKAVNTDYESPEDVDHLLEKTAPYAKNWKPMADKLWDEQKK